MCVLWVTNVCVCVASPCGAVFVWGLHANVPSRSWGLTLLRGGVRVCGAVLLDAKSNALRQTARERRLSAAPKAPAKKKNHHTPRARGTCTCLRRCTMSLSPIVKCRRRPAALPPPVVSCRRRQTPPQRARARPQIESEPPPMRKQKPPGKCAGAQNRQARARV